MSSCLPASPDKVRVKCSDRSSSLHADACICFTFTGMHSMNIFVPQSWCARGKMRACSCFCVAQIAQLRTKMSAPTEHAGSRPPTRVVGIRHSVHGSILLAATFGKFLLLQVSAISDSLVEQTTCIEHRIVQPGTVKRSGGTSPSTQSSSKASTTRRLASCTCARSALAFSRCSRLRFVVQFGFSK